MNKVEIGKKYRTRNGRAVRVLCTDAKDSTCPVIALVTEGEVERVKHLTESGHYSDGGLPEHAYDLIEASPWDDFKVDEPVMVREYSSAEWARRYFAGVLDGRAATWANGVTSWSNQTERRTTLWSQCRRPTEEEMQTKVTLNPSPL